MPLIQAPAEITSTAYEKNLKSLNVTTAEASIRKLFRGQEKTYRPSQKELLSTPGLG